MPDYLVRDLQLGISGIPEASYNALVPGSTDPTGTNTNNYLGMLTTGRGFPLPDKDKQDDSGKVGYGREFAREQRSGYIVPPTMEITDELNTEIAAILLRRAMGGADTPTPQGAPDTFVHQHTWVMLANNTAAGRQLPASSVVYALGGADYLYGGCCVDSFRIEQAGSNVPTFTAGLVGSGLFRRIRDLSATPVGVPPADTTARPAVPTPTKQNYALGAETYMKWTTVVGGVTTTYYITDVQRLKGFSMTLSNNLRTDDRRPGDPRIDATSTRKGWYVNRMNHGDRNIAGEMTLMLDDVLQELIDANDDVEVTNFTYRARGHYVAPAIGGAASTTKQHTLELVFPKCYFRNVRGGDDGGDATVTLGIFVVEDPATIFGLARATVLNNRATAIV